MSEKVTIFNREYFALDYLLDKVEELKKEEEKHAKQNTGGRSDTEPRSAKEKKHRFKSV